MEPDIFKVDELHYWECRNRSHTTEQRTHCSSRVTTKLVNDEHVLVSDRPQHEHEPAPRNAETLKFRDNIKRSAAADNGPPAKLVSRVAAEYSTVVQHQLSMNAQIKIVKRTRPSVHGKEPTSLEGFVVPEELQKTVNGVQFFHGVVESKGEKALIFTTEKDLRRLAQSRFWVADATFDTVPGLFRQLFSIHGSVGPDHTSTVPIVYALMQSKAELLYQHVLQQIGEIATQFDIELNPSVILTDFERGMITAFQREFPESRHSGCFFHLSQNIWKRVQNNGLVQKFKASSGIYFEHYKRIQALAFLPPAEIPKGFEILLKELPEDFLPIVSYLEEYYVLGRKKAGRKGVRTQPLFPPSLWSVHQNVTEGLPRTTNLVEAWHSRWAKVVGAQHVGTIKMIEELRLEQKSANDRADVFLAGGGPSKKLEYQQKDSKLSKVVAKYDKYSTYDYIKAIADNL